MRVLTTITFDDSKWRPYRLVPSIRVHHVFSTVRHLPLIYHAAYVLLASSFTDRYNLLDRIIHFKHPIHPHTYITTHQSTMVYTLTTSLAIYSSPTTRSESIDMKLKHCTITTTQNIFPGNHNTTQTTTTYISHSILPLKIDYTRQLCFTFH